jgi:hypothetical protein
MGHASSHLCHHRACPLLHSLAIVFCLPCASRICAESHGAARWLLGRAGCRPDQRVHGASASAPVVSRLCPLTSLPAAAYAHTTDASNASLQRASSRHRRHVPRQLGRPVREGLPQGIQPDAADPARRVDHKEGARQGEAAPGAGHSPPLLVSYVLGGGFFFLGTQG